MDYLMYLKTFYLWFDHFLDPWTEICQIFRWFFEKFEKSKRHSEINWPLTSQQSAEHGIVVEYKLIFICYQKGLLKKN